jgi:hypothetical protein
MKEEEQHKVKLNNMIDEKCAEIFFLARESYNLPKNSEEEFKLFELINKFKSKLKKKCKEHFENED